MGKTAARPLPIAFRPPEYSNNMLQHLAKLSNNKSLPYPRCLSFLQNAVTAPLTYNADLDGDLFKKRNPNIAENLLILTDVKKVLPSLATPDSGGLDASSNTQDKPAFLKPFASNPTSINETTDSSDTNHSNCIYCIEASSKTSASPGYRDGKTDSDDRTGLHGFAVFSHHENHRKDVQVHDETDQHHLSSKLTGLSPRGRALSPLPENPDGEDEKQPVAKLPR